MGDADASTHRERIGSTQTAMAPSANATADTT